MRRSTSVPGGRSRRPRGRPRSRPAPAGPPRSVAPSPERTSVARRPSRFRPGDLQYHTVRLRSARDGRRHGRDAVAGDGAMARAALIATSGEALYRVSARLGRRPLRAVRRAARGRAAGRLGPSLSAWSPSSGAATAACTRRSPAAGSTRCAAAVGPRSGPPRRLAGGVRRRCLDLAALRCRDEPRARLLLPPVAPLGWPADRGRLVATSGSPGCRSRPTPGRHPSTSRGCARPTHADGRDARPGPARSRSGSARTGRSRCSCSTPATTRSRSVPASPTCGRRSACASAPTGSSTPTRSRRRRARSAGRASRGALRLCRSGLLAHPRRHDGLRRPALRPGRGRGLGRPASQARRTAAAGSARTRRSCAGRSSGSRSSTCHGPPPGPSRRSGSGGRAPARPISTSAGAPTSGASTSSTPSGSSKHTLGWTTPALRTPEQADRWTWLVVAAYTELRLARRPRRRPAACPGNVLATPAQLTPARVRRGFRRLRASLGTPASPPKPSTPGPGRPKGTRRPPRTRYPAVKKTAPTGLITS